VPADAHYQVGEPTEPKTTAQVVDTWEVLVVGMLVVAVADTLVAGMPVVAMIVASFDISFISKGKQRLRM
jgi:hypothetical protein